MVSIINAKEFHPIIKELFDDDPYRKITGFKSDNITNINELDKYIDQNYQDKQFKPNINKNDKDKIKVWSEI